MACGLWLDQCLQDCPSSARSFDGRDCTNCRPVPTMSLHRELFLNLHLLWVNMYTRKSYASIFYKRLNLNVNVVVVYLYRLNKR